jgi:hypothetical protein
MVCGVAESVDSGSLHSGQRLAKPGLFGLSSNSSEHTMQVLIGKVISFHGKGNDGLAKEAGSERL